MAASTSIAGAQTQGVDFDDGVEAYGGVVWSFERDSVARTSSGDIVAPGTPRFADLALLAGAPSDLIELTTTSARPYAAGYDLDGSPILVVRNGAFLDIHVGHEADIAAYVHDDFSSTYRFDLIDPDNMDEPNLLKGQTGVDGDASYVDYAFDPRGAQVFDGLIVVQCNVRHDHDGIEITDYRSVKTALLWTTVERLENAEEPWLVGAISAPIPSGSADTGQPWSINSYPLDDTHVAVTVCSYVTSQKLSGHAYVSVFERARQWSLVSSTVLAHSESSGEHYHCAGIIRHADERLSVLISVGDNIENNRLIARTKAPGPWSGDLDWSYSGLFSEHTIRQPSEMWTPEVVVWGDNDATTPRMHNQFVDVVAADEQLSALICAADESSPTLMRLDYDPDAEACTWTRLYMPAISSWPNERPVNLSIEGMPGGPYVSRAGAQTWTVEGQPESRVLYSPDGVQWTQCLAPGVTAQTPVAMADGRIWIGSGDDHGLRSFSPPATMSGQPIQLAGAGANHLIEMDLPTALGPGVEVVKLAGAQDLPANVSPPPCDDSNIFRIRGTQDSGKYGTWIPTGALPRPDSSILVRYWVSAPGPDGDVFTERTTPSIWTRIQATDGSDNIMTLGRLRTDTPDWMPVTGWFRADMFGGLLADPWTFKVLLFAMALTRQPAPAEFYIAWDAVSIDRPAIDGHGAPPQSPGATESGLATNWSIGDKYTFLAYAMVPFDAWDNRMGGGVAYNDLEHTLIRLKDSASGDSLEVTAAPVSIGVGLHATLDGEKVGITRPDVAYWLRGSPVLLAIVGDGKKTVLYASVGGAPITTITLSGVSVPFDSIELGATPMLWSKVQGVQGARSATDVMETLRRLGDLNMCPPDINGDGVLNVLDFIAFQNAFLAQDAVADCDQDADWDVIDFICFQNAFVAGCD